MLFYLFNGAISLIKHSEDFIKISCKYSPAYRIARNQCSCPRNDFHVYIESFVKKGKCIKINFLFMFEKIRCCFAFNSIINILIQRFFSCCTTVFQCSNPPCLYVFCMKNKIRKQNKTKMIWNIPRLKFHKFDT